MTFKTLATGLGAGFLLCMGAVTASAQDNPLLQPADNPLLQPAEPSQDDLLAQQARAIDAAATKPASDPVCQNIRANYDQQLSKILDKAKDDTDVMSMSQINRMSSKSRGTAYRLNRINRNLTGNRSGALGDASRKISQGTSVINDAAEIGNMLGISGKKNSAKKTRKKVEKLDAQALDAVRQTGCPMATFD